MQFDFTPPQSIRNKMYRNIRNIRNICNTNILCFGSSILIDITRTALSGTMGLFQTTGDEFAYLVDPRGYKISAVNPREHVTIAFGCNE